MKITRQGLKNLDKNSRNGRKREPHPVELNLSASEDEWLDFWGQDEEDFNPISHKDI